ncbi:hypothetical protein [Helicobacter macacae]|nr:hypothetical protein [Helicobacter macacae]
MVNILRHNFYYLGRGLKKASILTQREGALRSEVSQSSKIY